MSLTQSLHEHRRCEEGDGAQRLLAGVLEIVAHRRRQDEHAAGSDLMRGPVFEIELAGSGDDILRLLGRVSVPAEPLSRLDLGDDGRRGSRPVSAIDGERRLPTYGRISFAPHLGARQLVGSTIAAVRAFALGLAGDAGIRGPPPLMMITYASIACKNAFALAYIPGASLSRGPAMQIARLICRPS